MFTLFQIMTLESWSMGVVRPVMLEHPYAWIFFVLFILVATFTMLNLFIGVIVDTMQIMHARERERAAPAASTVADAEPGELTREIRALRVEVAQLQETVAKFRR